MDAVLAHVIVYDYIDFRRYLLDWMESVKERRPKLGWQWLANQTRAALPARARPTASHLRNVVAGERKLNAEHAAALAPLVTNTPEEALCFQLLVAANQAPEGLERALATKRLMDLYDHLGVEPAHARSFRIFGNRAVPAVMKLAAYPGFVPDPQRIAAQLGGSVHPDEVRDALRILLQHGLLVSPAPGAPPRPAARPRFTKGPVGDLARLLVLDGALAEAHNRLARGPRAEGAVAPVCPVITGALPESWADRLRCLSEELQGRIDALIAGDLAQGGPDCAPEQVVLVVLGAIPASEALRASAVGALPSALGRRGKAS